MIPVESGVIFIIYTRILPAEPFPVLPDRADHDADAAG
jgi:hypothetical protein